MFFSKIGSSPQIDMDPSNFATGNFSSSSSSRKSSSSSSAEVCHELDKIKTLVPTFNAFQVVKKASKTSEPDRPWFDDNDKKATNRLLQQISSLHLNEEMSDVEFVVDGRHFPAHRLILATRCKYFKAIGTIDFKANDCDLNIELLGFAHKYGLLELQDLLVAHLESCLSAESVYSILSAAMLYSIKQLVDQCVDYCQKHMLHFLESKCFPSCCFHVLQEVLNRINWSSSENQLALAIICWIRANPEHAEDMRELMRKKANLELMEINSQIHLFKRLDIVDGTLLRAPATEDTFGKEEKKERMPESIYCFNF
uniref:BTB domain-containing protein n=1 Tax=Ditylenchus dipsaci TaxID=166011 RepID=A0A915DBT9_9BILA